MSDKTVAVLARTNLALRPIEQALIDAGIKYKNLGKSGYFSQPEVKSVLAYMGCVLYPADWLVSGAIRSPFHPSKFLPKSKLLAELKSLKDHQEDVTYWQLMTQEPQACVESKNLSTLREFVSFIHQLSRYRDLKADDALKHVIQALRAVEYYKDEEPSPDSSPLENLAELVKIASRYSSIKEFLDFCRRAAAASKSKSSVVVATCHAAKGLEFHTVFLIGCQEGLFPHAKSDDLEGERNCFFVGCSRAERELFLTYSGLPSPFISGIIEASKKESE